MNPQIVRQPIFDRDEITIAYEVLCTPSLEEIITQDPQNRALTQAVKASTTGPGGARTRILLEFTPGLLVGPMDRFPPKSALVVQLPERLDLTDDVLAACGRLKEAGYTLAAGAFVLKDKYKPLTYLVDILRFDLPEMLAAGKDRNYLIMRAQGTKLLGCNLNSREAFLKARGRGCTYFQGRYFISPNILPREKIPLHNWNYLHFFQGIYQKEIDYTHLEEIIEKDEQLSSELLEFVNSDAFDTKLDIESVRHALSFMGPSELKQWGALLAFSKVSADLPQEALFTCFLRGKFLERLGAGSGQESRSEDLFSLGVLSMVDLFFGFPKSEILADIYLDEDIRAVLLGEDSAFKPFLDLVIAYESGDWDTVKKNQTLLNLDEKSINKAYWEALGWTQKQMVSDLSP